MSNAYRPYGQATVVEKFGILGFVVNALGAAVVASVTALWRGAHGAPTYYKHVLFSAIRAGLGSVSVSTLQCASSLPSTRFQAADSHRWASPPLDQMYLDFARKKAFQPDCLVLPDNCLAHWLGPRQASKVIVFLHGGGYVMPPTPAHLDYLYDLQKLLGDDVAIVMLAYFLAPQFQYPKQLEQAAMLLQILLEKEGKHPSQITLMGDSAGGNLLLALLSHLLHPHSSITPISLPAPLAAAVAISPQCDYAFDYASFRANAASDVCTAPALARWGPAFLGDKSTNNYNEPARAGAGWWKDVDAVVERVLVWGGGGEILIDGIVATADALGKAHKGVTTIVQSGACHEEMIVDLALGLPKGEAAQAIESYLQAYL